ncbi:hypothetical protein TRV_02182 [Trichophyton verrucosum HKI 0517]|uniref:Uncharacterized protein n=1 Tax=Trichophyton verrucosum (strain HKI 0517) TaxID=663202 RepID=D4D513_TRIVH|nr:uncharacterized protein TRV_02182 [Trichophyton verrucosum HKI 0517]EFE43056.1 hypothetical protein TRV_02182 [Trichophyton verrucosum HKI 0517]
MVLSDTSTSDGARTSSIENKTSNHGEKMSDYLKRETSSYPERNTKRKKKNKENEKLLTNLPTRQKMMEFTQCEGNIEEG